MASCKATIDTCDLQVLDGTKITLAQFDEEIRRNKPVIFSGLTANWAAADPTTGWSNASAFAERFGEFDLPLRSWEALATRGPAYHGERVTVDVLTGMSLLEAAHKHDIELEGACEGSLACSTCHIVLEDEYYDKLEEPDDDENDMLDLAFGLTETSRLGCQVIATKELDGMTVSIPGATRNFSVDGYVPPKH